MNKELYWFLQSGYNFYYKPTKERIYKSSQCILKPDFFTSKNPPASVDIDGIIVTTYEGNEYTFPLAEVEARIARVEAGCVAEQVFYERYI